MENYLSDKNHCEFLRQQSKSKFDQVRGTWLDCGRWGAPYRTQWLLSQTQGERNNNHIVDPTHTLALRSYVAGFLEGNTSATRPWYRLGTGDADLNQSDKVKEWLDIFTRLTLKQLSSSNFYHAAGQFYYDYGVFNTGAYYIEELPNGTLYWHVLTPGSYYVVNNSLGEAVVMVREYQLNVKSLVGQYGKKKDGVWDWSNFSSAVKKMYNDGNYTSMVDVVEIIEQNPDYTSAAPSSGMNRRWISKVYEMGTSTSGPYYQNQPSFTQTDAGNYNEDDRQKYLKISYSKRKPFIVGKSMTNGNFEYGQQGPTLDALGLIKSLNKKAIVKDQALEQMIKPTTQGPMNLKKSYITNAPNTYIPLDATGLMQGGVKRVFEINPAIAELSGDVEELRQMVNRLYYADYLLYLSMNPKTRTAAETHAVVNEQQIVIGPNLQSLNWTHNVPIIDYNMEFTLENDPLLPDIPEELAGQFLRPEFISVFAQAQRAADLPAVDRYMAMIMNVAQIDPSVLQKANLDRLCDLYEDRLYLPAKLNRDQSETDEMRAQQQAAIEKQQKMEALATMAGAAKDVGITANKGAV